MPDVHTPEVRSRNMSAVRGKNTKPEIQIRSELHRRGFRYRLHGRDLPGRPDLIFPKFGAVLFVHGCFWHRHGCELFRLPGTRREFWEAKLSGNVQRDDKAVKALQSEGWRVGIVWECALRGRGRLSNADVADRIAVWLTSKRPVLVLEGEHQSALS